MFENCKVLSACIILICFLSCYCPSPKIPKNKGVFDDDNDL